MAGNAPKNVIIFDIFFEHLVNKCAKTRTKYY